MKKKILFVLHIPPPVNGAAIMGQYIKNSKIINKRFETEYINLSTSFSLDKIGKGGVNKLMPTFKILVRVVKSLVNKNHDLCYMTLTAKGPGFYKDVLVVTFLKLFGKNIIYHFHNKGVKVNSENRINRFLYRYVFKNTKSILLSPKLYYDIKDYVKESDVYYCPNGIHEIKGIGPNVIEPLKKDSVCTLLFLSNMMEEKGVLELLKACQLLKAKDKTFECHFVGAWSDISEKYFFEKVSEYGLGKYIFAHGKKYNDDKLDFFNIADIFVFPTYYHNETFGLVILEAMQAKLPVVSTYEGGIPDVVDDGITGVLVEQKNAEMLADKLEMLINEPELREKMGNAGRKRYLDLFELQKFENKLADILESVVSWK